MLYRTGFPCPLPSWTLSGKAPKAPGTPPAAEKPKGKRPSHDQAAMRMIRAALQQARPMAAVEVPPNALVALDPSVTGTVMPALPSGLRVKRKYTKRKSGTPLAAALWRGDAGVSGPWGATGQQALMLGGDMHNAAARIPGQAVLFGSPVADSAAASEGQPALEAVSMQVGDLLNALVCTRFDESLDQLYCLPVSTALRALRECLIEEARLGMRYASQSNLHPSCISVQ